MKTIPERGATERERDNRIRELIRGQSNATGEFTLIPGATITPVSDPLVSEGSVITLMPKTSTAAAELITLYIAPVQNGTFTVNHRNNAQADRTYGYRVNGA